MVVSIGDGLMELLVQEVGPTLGGGEKPMSSLIMALKGGLGVGASLEDCN